VLDTPFSPWPSFTREEADAVANTLLSNRVNYWTGDRCREFERRFAEWTGSRHAVALANGTVALDAALKALGVGPGDEVVTTPRTFLASASSMASTISGRNTETAHRPSSRLVTARRTSAGMRRESASGVRQAVFRGRLVAANLRRFSFSISSVSARFTTWSRSPDGTACPRRSCASRR